MTVSPKISIITCFYNAALYLEEAVNSVLQQEYTHWELLLIDDGSTDGSTAIAQAYAAQYGNQIIYVEHEDHQNKGLSASRNVGIRVATGSLITFLDADDVWLPSYLNHQVQVLQQSNASMVCEATEYWYSWRDAKLSDVVIPIGTSANTLYTPPQLMLNLYPLGAGAAPCVCGIIIKKEVLLKHGGFEDAFTGMYEDQVFLSKLYLNEPIYISDACNNRYRQRQDSLVGSNQQRGQYFTVRMQYLTWLEQYIQQHDIHFPAVNTALQTAMQPTLVSVIIAFYNEERFLAEAVESVIQQDYPHWELVLVDDGSSDRSTAIAREYAAQYVGKIRYHEHENHSNKGLSASRNAGIRQAKGDIISILDADDVWLPSKISGHVMIFQQYPETSMVVEGSIYWNDWNDPTKRNFEIPVGAMMEGQKNWMKWATPDSENICLPSDMELDRVYERSEVMSLLYPFGTGAAPCPCSWSIKKEAIERVGGFEESFTKENQLYEDQAFLFKIYLQEKVFISSAFNNYYRQRPESIVKWVKAKGHYKAVRKYFLEWMQAYLKKHGIQDAHLDTLIKKALFPYRYPNYYYMRYTFPVVMVNLLKKALPVMIKKHLKTALNPKP